MNDWDRDNFEFLSKAGQDEWEAWFDQASTNDIEYALQLFKMAKTELLVAELEILDEVTDFTLANSFINRVKEKL